METDPALETCTESRAETGGEETREGPITRPSPLSPNRSTATHTPTALTSTPPQLTSSCPPKLTLTPTFTPFSSSTPTPNPPKLTPTPSSPPTLTRKTPPSLTSTVLNPTPTFTPTSPSLTPNPLTSKILTPSPTLPTLTTSLPTLKHSSSPSPTQLTHKPAPLPLTPPTLTPTAPLLTPSPSPPSPTISAIPSLPLSVTHGKMSFAPGPSFFLTNGNARTPTTPTSPPITPFHTPASRQVPLPRPLGTPTLVQANQSISPVRPRVSQQALLLGRSPCSSRDQMLLRAQMLQSLTLRPSAPGTLTIPPSLRLKPPSSSLSPISRPLTPLFPPLRPRPQPSSMATDRQTPPTRRLSVPPPTLYTSVRSVPLRPRLHSPNGHRVVPPRHSPAMRPFAAAAAHQALPSRQCSPIDLQRPSDCPIGRPPDLPHKDQEDLCENMSTQSDNHSVLSSLSSQSPPASPCLTPPSDFPPPLLPVSPSHSETLSLSQSRSETLRISEREPWTQRVWPEGGRRVLTHLVEGFVIQEGLQAFPVNRSSLLLGGQEGVFQNGNTKGAELLPLTDTPEPPEHSSESEQVGVATDDPLTGNRARQRGVLQCESCGKRGHAHSFHRSKRYCSTSCARRLNVGMSKRVRALSAGSQPEGRRSEINKEESVPGKPLLLRLPREIWSAHRRDYEGEEGHAVPITTRLERRAARRARRASEPAMTPSNPIVTSTESTPAQWSVEQVWDFIHTLPGCVEVAEAFRVQEIDGQALLLLTEDHLMTSMNIKLGPALKICAHINTLRHT
uniref:Polyhomeotic-like protein 2 n=1 Tax=Salmo trutta TaxID=8032 RepID=A0A674DMA9_SALTR